MSEENLDRQLIRDLITSMKDLKESVDKNRDATIGLFALFDELLTNANQLPKKLLEGFAEKLFGPPPTG